MQQTPNGKPKKKKKAGPLFIIILVFAICVFVFAGYNLLKIYFRYKEASDSYKEVAQMLEVNPDYIDADEEVDPDDPDGPVAKGDDAKRRNDSVPFIWDYNKILALNPDTKGWLYVKDLFNYPIVQGKDNDYYLHTTFDGTPNPSGTLFIDSEMKKGLKGKYCIVYGHNMNDGSMFGNLLKYHQEEDFYKKHPIMHVFSEDRHFVYNVTAGYYASLTGFTYTDALNNADVTDYVDKARKESIYEMYQGKVTDKTKVIVLSTCTETSSDEYRFVVILTLDHEVK